MPGFSLFRVNGSVPSFDAYRDQIKAALCLGLLPSNSTVKYLIIRLNNLSLFHVEITSEKPFNNVSKMIRKSIQALRCMFPQESCIVGQSYDYKFSLASRVSATKYVTKPGFYFSDKMTLHGREFSPQKILYKLLRRIDYLLSKCGQKDSLLDVISFIAVTAILCHICRFARNKPQYLFKFAMHKSNNFLYAIESELVNLLKQFCQFNLLYGCNEYVLSIVDFYLTNSFASAKTEKSYKTKQKILYQLLESCFTGRSLSNIIHAHFNLSNLLSLANVSTGEFVEYEKIRGRQYGLNMMDLQLVIKQLKGQLKTTDQNTNLMHVFLDDLHAEISCVFGMDPSVSIYLKSHAPLGMLNMIYIFQEYNANRLALTFNIVEICEHSLFELSKKELEYLVRAVVNSLTKLADNKVAKQCLQLMQQASQRFVDNPCKAILDYVQKQLNQPASVVAALRASYVRRTRAISHLTQDVSPGPVRQLFQSP